jgi:hypothetical protein
MKKVYICSIHSVLCLLLFVSEIDAQTCTSMQESLSKLPEKFIDKVNKKAARTEKQLIQKTEKYLAKLQKQEARLKKKLSKIDSLAANNIFDDEVAKYDQYQQKIISKTPEFRAKAKQYLPFFDTLKTSLKFLEQQKDLLKNVKESSGRLKESISKLQSLDNKLAQAENIKKFVKERRQFLAEQLKKFGLAKELTKYNKQAYYYGQQIQEYKTLLNQPEILLEKSVGQLNKIPLFREFISKHSELVALFPLPYNSSLVNNNQAMVIPGLQTRTQVQQQIQTTIAAGGSNAQTMVQQNLQQAKEILSQYKEKVYKIGGGNGELEMPEGFKTNNQKTRTFWKRLEYGTNMQSQKSTYFFPTTSDIGLSVGYKLNDKNIIGIGSSFKIGWGQTIRNIKLSAEGLSLRSFIDLKLKGSFFISGGYEQNYWASFKNAQQLINQPNKWSNSGLVGVSKTVSIKTKFFKKTKLQLLWDFMSYQQVPKTQPVLFRGGYNF